MPRPDLTAPDWAQKSGLTIAAEIGVAQECRANLKTVESILRKLGAVMPDAAQ